MKKYRQRKVIAALIYAPLAMLLLARPFYLHALEPYTVSPGSGETIPKDILWGVNGIITSAVLFVALSAIYWAFAAMYIAAAYPKENLNH